METITDADYTLDLTNTPAPAKSLQHSLEQPARDLVYCINFILTQPQHMSKVNFLSRV